MLAEHHLPGVGRQRRQGIEQALQVKDQQQRTHHRLTGSGTHRRSAVDQPALADLARLRGDGLTLCGLVEHIQGGETDGQCALRIHIGQPLGVKPSACEAVPTGESILSGQQGSGIIALQCLDKRRPGCC